MQRSSVTLTNIPRKVLQYNNYYRHLLLKNQVDAIKPPPPGTTCDIFISHRGIDTKRTIAGLLHYHLSRLGLRPFLDSKNMKPGDKLFDKIDSAILDSKLGLAVFSPRYCDSYFCLHELSLIMETKKRVIPIFCDVKPSELLVKDNGSCPAQDLQRFRDALHEAKYTVGLTFDTYKENWSEFLTTATDAIIKNLIEVDGEGSPMIKNRKYFVENY